MDQRREVHLPPDWRLAPSLQHEFNAGDALHQIKAQLILKREVRRDSRFADVRS
jgi:hypothetical protein